MSDIPKPTTEDLARDLEADLNLFGDASDSLWVRFLRVDQDTHRAARFIEMAKAGWPAAIHRARFAEALNAELLAACKALLADPDTADQSAWDRQVGKARELARAAIAKAKGG